MLTDVFISYAEEDGEVAARIAARLEAMGYSCWCFEGDSHGGLPHPEQTAEQIESCQAMVLVISRASVASRQVGTEVFHAHESAKEILPVLHELTYEEFQQLKPPWRSCLRAASAISIPVEGPSAVAWDIVNGLQALDCWPSAAEGTTSLGLPGAMVYAVRPPDRTLAVVHVRGEIDVANTHQVRELFLLLLRDSVTRVVLDLSDLEYVDSAALGMLVGILKRLHEQGGDLRLAGLPRRVSRVFEFTGLNRVFRIYDTTEEALRSFEAEAG